jgi:uncharacterized integral membrane protein
MRLLVILMTILLFVGILGFVLTNLDTQVGITLWESRYENLPLFVVVILSTLAGIVYAGLIAVAEGAHIRIANRRLRREVQKLETELNYLRTQRTPTPGREPDTIERSPAAESARPSATPPIASAPVYGSGSEGADPDDPYSGGRAV